MSTVGPRNRAPIPRRGLMGPNSPEGMGVTQEPPQARAEAVTPKLPSRLYYG